MFRGSCLCFSLCPSLWSCLGTTERKSLSSLLAGIDEFSLNLLISSCQSQLFQPLLIGEMPWSSFFLLVASHSPLSSILIFFLFWRTQNWTQYPRCGLTSAHQRGEIISHLVSHLKEKMCEPPALLFNNSMLQTKHRKTAHH